MRTLKIKFILFYSSACLGFFLTPLIVAAASAPETLTSEPQIRVGIYNPTSWVKIKVDTEAQLINENGKIVWELPANKTIKLKFKNNRYFAVQGDFYRETKHYLKVVPKVSTAILTITNYEARPAWNQELNDNQFLGQLELRYAETTSNLWLINELPMESYISGVCEASNDNDPAYLKALYTAARTYAGYLYLHPTKHASDNILVTNTAADQVYCGYGFTLRSPNVAAAVTATAGKYVTYNDVLALTPYFSQSDGRTRSWSEVWNGDYAYLISVSDPGCAGEELLGHGVGLSASGARYFAETEDWGWKTILKYYYTGVKLKKLY